jgi:hypothetical protein
MAIYLDLEKTNTLVNGSDFYTLQISSSGSQTALSLILNCSNYLLLNFMYQLPHLENRHISKPQKVVWRALRVIYVALPRYSANVRLLLLNLL